MPASSQRGPLWLRAGLPAMVAIGVLLVALSALGVLPTAGESPVDSRGVTPIPTRTPDPRIDSDGDNGDGTGGRTSVNGTGSGNGTSGNGLAIPAAEPHTTAAGSWSYPDTVGPLLGTVGPLLRFRVAVEHDIPVAVWDFANLIDATLGDQRSWIAGHDVRLQRMPWQAVYDFTIYLATPETAYRLCLQGGVDITEKGVPYTSCRAGDSVVINSERYLHAVPGYIAPIDDYRQYVINHEVGHRLGHGHELCPEPGRPAPVMEQQTLGLQGCVANSWPYVDGKLYGGPPTT